MDADTMENTNFLGDTDIFKKKSKRKRSDSPGEFRWFVLYFLCVFLFTLIVAGPGKVYLAKFFTILWLTTIAVFRELNFWEVSKPFFGLMVYTMGIGLGFGFLAWHILPPRRKEKEAPKT